LAVAYLGRPIYVAVRDAPKDGVAGGCRGVKRGADSRIGPSRRVSIEGLLDVTDSSTADQGRTCANAGRIARGRPSGENCRGHGQQQEREKQNRDGFAPGGPRNYTPAPYVSHSTNLLVRTGWG